MTQLIEDVRAAKLLDAQAKAVELFGVSRHWHKRIVRAGPNTLQPCRENPPDRSIGADDIVFCDSGPIFEEWEADLGRTYVLGDDPVKAALREYYITPGSDQPSRRTDRTGRRCHSILEVHLVDRDREIGGFHEELLDLGHDASAG